MPAVLRAGETPAQHGHLGRGTKGQQGPLGRESQDQPGLGDGCSRDRRCLVEVEAAQHSGRDRGLRRLTVGLNQQATVQGGRAFKGLLALLSSVRRPNRRRPAGAHQGITTTDQAGCAGVAEALLSGS